jgi:hypothetical protein
MSGISRDVNKSENVKIGHKKMLGSLREKSKYVNCSPSKVKRLFNIKLTKKEKIRAKRQQKRI